MPETIEKEYQTNEMILISSNFDSLNKRIDDLKDRFDDTQDLIKDLKTI